MATSFERGEQAIGARQEAEHNEAETEIVGLGQRVQTAEGVGEAQQAHRAGEEEKDAGADRGDAEEVDDETHRPIRSIRIRLLRRRARC